MLYGVLAITSKYKEHAIPIIENLVGLIGYKHADKLEFSIDQKVKLIRNATSALVDKLDNADQAFALSEQFRSMAGHLLLSGLLRPLEHGHREPLLR